MSSSEIASPQRDANAISTSVANTPPSATSWYASSRPSRFSACTGEECGQPRRVVEIRGTLAQLAVNLRQRRAAEPALPGAEIDPQQQRRADVEPQQRRQRPAHVGHRRERRHDQRQRRRHRLFGAALAGSRHVVRIDIESLPTGMLSDSAGHSSIATARTVSYSAASSPG